MHIRLDGKDFDLEATHIVDKLEGHTPQPITKYSVNIDQVTWPIKQVLALATGVGTDRFTSQEARRRLRKIGLTIDSADTTAPKSTAAAPKRRSFEAAQLIPADSLNLEVRLQWSNAGNVALDKSGSPTFPGLPDTPGLYRFDFGTAKDGRTVLYIGESKKLSNRAKQYRQAKSDRTTAFTSRRLHKRMVEHLSDGGRITMAIVTDVRLGDNTAVTLGRKSGRLLAESAAVVAAHLDPKILLLNIDDDILLDSGM